MNVILEPVFNTYKDGITVPFEYHQKINLLVEGYSDMTQKAQAKIETILRLEFERLNKSK